MAPPTSSHSFFDAIKHRRTYYVLNKDIPVPLSRLEEIVHDATISLPSSFNAQSTRLVILVGTAQDDFWDIVLEVLKPHLNTPEKVKHTSAKLGGFRAAYGTILFFEDPAPTTALAQKFKHYADKFPQWAEHQNAMNQFALWTAFEAEGLGCNLQHYNPVIDVATKERFGVPMDWSLKSQLVFGGINESRKGMTEGKEIQPVEERVFWHGKP